mgnify:CR=1 FL=1
MRLAALWMMAGVLVACRSEEKLVDTGGLDLDGDGAPMAIDCDDDNAAVSPDTVELCNGFDDDCDGLIDEDDADDAPTWYADADGDGYGGPDFSERSCVARNGWVADNTDCDDGDPAAFPGAAENEAPPYGSDALCMRDNDGDGFGDAAPTGGATAGEDCDDTDAGVHPNASEECDGVDTDCDGLPITDELDGDGDRYVTCDRDDTIEWRGDPSVAGGSDCDDDDDVATPGATEVCDSVDNDCDGTVDENDAVDAAFWYLDADGDTYGDPDVSVVSCDAGDGWVLDATDCDDGAATVYPGALERCDDDDIDDDCDGESDEDDAIDPTAWYRDNDGDGWADLTATVTACDPPSTSWIAVGPSVDGDCDDDDATVSPDGTEVCDEVDNDCDGDTDEDDADDAVTRALDLDGDGYGDPAYTHTSCDAPSGFVDNTDDCDDTLDSVNPAATELCNGLDDDCDGDTDEDDADDAATWYLDYDGDGAGGATWTTVSCTAPSGYVESGDDCDDFEADAYPGRAEVCNDGIVDNDCDASTTCSFDAALDTTQLDGQLDGPSAGATLGTALANLDDHDGDGQPDLLVAVPGGNRVLVVGLDDSTSTLSDGTIARWDGEDGDEAGGAIAGGDFDGQGYGDLAIGATGSDTLAFVLGPTTGTQSLSTADALVTDSSGSGFASALSVAGDVDGNGVVELLVGAPDSSTGRAWLLEGPVSSIDVDDCDTYARCIELTTGTSGDGYGSVVASAGDLDADGLDELAVAAPNTSADAGALWVLSGPLTGSALVSTDGILVSGDAAGDLAGSVVAPGGDLDNDGYDDLIVGAPGADSSTGAVYVVNGPITGPVDLGAADVTLTGSATGDAAGSAAASAGDLDGDGQADLAVGGPDAGLAWVVLGPVTANQALSSADVTSTAPSTSSFGGALAGPGDVNGDGLDDLFIGSPTYDGPADEAGAIWMLQGIGD